MFGVKSNKERLWIITELFYPEETSTSFILSKIANKLSDKYDVKVLCGYPTYDKNSRKPSFEISDTIDIKRIKSFAGSKDKIIHRMLRFMTLSIALCWSAMINIRKSDKVFIVTNPAPLLVLISLLKKIKRFELNVLVHDVFPENTIPAGIIKSKKSFFYKILKAIFDKAYGNASRLIVLGRDMKSIMEKKLQFKSLQPEIVIVPNWGDTINIQALPKNTFIRNDENAAKKIVFQYAGNMGRVQGLLELLDIISKVNNDKICFDFIGDGAVKNDMIDFVRHNKMMHKVSFYPPYRRDEQQEVLGKCDVAIITLAKGMKGLGVPSKTYNILSAGKPVLFIGDEDSEISMLVREHEIGYTFVADDTLGLYNFFNSLTESDLLKLKLMGKKSREIAEQYYSEDKVLEKFYEIL